MDDDGWVKIWRRICESAVFQDPHLLKVWVWCLCQAAYRSRSVPVATGRGDTVVNLSPGQFIFGRKSAARILGMPPMSTRRRLGRLQELGCIRINAVTHFSVVTVCNWLVYQNCDHGEWSPNGHPKTAEVGHPKIFSNLLEDIHLCETDNEEWSPNSEEMWSPNGHPTVTNKKVEKGKNGGDCAREADDPTIQAALVHPSPDISGSGHFADVRMANPFVFVGRGELPEWQALCSRYGAPMLGRLCAYWRDELHAGTRPTPPLYLSEAIRRLHNADRRLHNAEHTEREERTG